MSRTNLIKAVGTLTTIVWTASCISVQNSATKVSFEAGDYIITQESRAAREQQRSKYADAYIFHLTRGGAIQRIASPPAVVAPRGIRAQTRDRFVFADALYPAIRVIDSRGKITTLYSGPPLIKPRDVAIDRDGGYVIADFESFEAGSPAAIFKLSRESKMTRVYEGRPLQYPHGVAVDRNGNYIVADGSGSIFRVHPDGAITVVATGRPLVAPSDVKVDASGNYIVADIGQVWDPATGVIDFRRSRNPGKLLRITPDGLVSIITVRRQGRFRAVDLHPDGNYIVVDRHNTIYRVTPEGAATVIYQGGPLHHPAGIAVVP